MEAEYEDLKLASDNDEVMMCFPKNDQGCIKYRRVCAYHDFCVAWPNLLQKIESVPIGWKVEFWDPREREKEAKDVWNLVHKGIR